jgi:3-deoxy-7-phosphoheptulonate synthase/chorismate mutase
MSESLSELRARIDRLNRGILELLQERAEVAVQIGALKKHTGIATYDPTREEAMIRDLLGHRTGRLTPSHIRAVFDTIFRASLDLQQTDGTYAEDGSRRVEPVKVGNTVVGGETPVMFFGPCSVESAEQIGKVAAFGAGLRGRAILRGGTFKPRTRHDSFQGLREEGIPLLETAGREHSLPTVSEVLDRASLAHALGHIDMIQIGARSMYNTELLKAVGKARVPVLLKRAFMATLDEYVAASEYIRAEGNRQIVLCERGIRSFDYRTRNTLDIAAVPLLQAETGLPVIVDVSHAVGRTDLILPCAKAALAVGADGLMVEVHPDPRSALSDGSQQIDLATFEELLAELDLAPDADSAPPAEKQPAQTGAAR